MKNNNLASNKEMELIFEDESNYVTYAKKQPCYDAEIDKDVYLSFDIVEGKKFKNFTAMSWDDLRDYVRTDNHLYEIIRDERPRYSYYDIEGSFTQVNKLYNVENMDELEKNVIIELKLAIENFKYENDMEEDTELVILSASTNAKLSLHVLDRNVILSNKDESKIYHETLFENVKNIPKVYHPLDKGVYDPDRNFRLFNQTKIGDPRPFKIKSDHSVNDTFITCVDKNKEVLKIPPRWTKVKKKVFVKTVKEQLEEAEKDELNMLIDKLDNKRFIEYTDWRNTVWCLYSCGATIDQIHFESETRYPENYNIDECDKVIKSYEHEKSKFNIDTLRCWARQDSGFEIDRILDKVPKAQSKNKAEHFQFLDLLRKYQGKEFHLMDGLDEFCKDVSSCVSMVLGSTTSFVMYTNDNNQYEMSSKIPELNFSISNEKETFNWLLQKYMIKNPLRFPLFNQIVFKPNNVGVKRNDLNIWSGFKAQEIEDVDMDIINVFTNHIKEVWADNNEEHYKYIMGWLAQVIKTPEKKTEVAILLQGGQGSGKTLPCDVLLEHVFGKDLGMTASGLGSLTQRFNGCTMGKIFSNVNELSVVDGDAFNASFDKMKSLITDRRLQVEKKGLEHIQIDNFNNFIMTTNHVHTVKLERDDRRYAVFSVSDKYKQDSNYFSHFMDTLDNQNAGDNIYTYFLRYEDMINVRKIPMTEIRRDLLDSCKSNVERFVSQMNEEIDEALLYDWVGKEGEKAVSCANFYEQYKFWCSANGEKGWSNKAVGSELKNKQLYKDMDKSRHNKRQAKYYVF